VDIDQLKIGHIVQLITIITKQGNLQSERTRIKKEKEVRVNSKHR
jgi:hypothetical protein